MWNFFYDYWNESAVSDKLTRESFQYHNSVSGAKDILVKGSIPVYTFEDYWPSSQNAKAYLHF